MKFPVSLSASFGLMILFLGISSLSHAANPSCSAAIAQAAAVPGMTVKDIPNLNPNFPATTGGVADIPSGKLILGSPEVCVITGSYVTDPASGKTANFGAVFPAGVNWNGKFMYRGCGGNCGAVFNPGPPTWDQLNKGYVVWSSDDGHQVTDPAWGASGSGAISSSDQIDFAYRAVHALVIQGKAFTEKYFGQRPRYSYYSGCSDGGREGMVEVNRYPEDFDGALVGDPEFDPPGQALNISNATVQLRNQNAALTPDQFAQVSSLVTAKCDAADGVSDGLIQNPALCNFDPQKDLPQCANDVPGANCFTQAQRESLSTLITALTDPSGQVIHPGYSVSNMNNGPGYNLATWAGFATPPANLTGPQPWSDPMTAPGAWAVNDPVLANWVFAGTPNYNSVSSLGFTYQSGGNGPIQSFHTIAPVQTINSVFGALNIAAGDFPSETSKFIQQDKKLLMYHGFSDGFITPYRTIQYYNELADLNGGYNRLSNNVQLYLVPGMYHCQGGPGPNVFGQDFHFIGGAPATNTALPQSDASHDALTALEQWVENGSSPQQLIATKFTNDDPSQPAQRSMPVCKYPEMAKYTGSGDVNDAANWRCVPGDTSLLNSGPNGVQAGVTSPLWNGR